jgi:hypothetical protein
MMEEGKVPESSEMVGELVYSGLVKSRVFAAEQAVEET